MMQTMFGGQSVGVALPAYNEEGNIEVAVNEFLHYPAVDEVLVVDNNSSDGTAAAVRRTQAKYVFEPRQGFGYALRRCLQEATTDIEILCEPDGTFVVSDIDKMLLYGRDFDAVFGARTSKACIWSGAHMPTHLRLGNIVAAKLLEYLHNGFTMTDVGCTFRLLKRNVVQDILPFLTVGESHFNVELMIWIMRRAFGYVEIPLQYRPRVGESKITGNTGRAIYVGLRMCLTMLRLRFKRIEPSPFKVAHIPAA